MKKTCCEVAFDFQEKEAELKEQADKSDDAKAIIKGINRFAGPELMFNPDSEKCEQLASMKEGGIHKIIFGSIRDAGESYPKSENDMSQNVVLSGGNTMFKGF